MNNENEIYNNISKSISKKSEYSDPFDNYEDIIRYSNLNNIKEKKKSIKEESSIYEDFFRREKYKYNERKKFK